MKKKGKVPKSKLKKSGKIFGFYPPHSYGELLDEFGTAKVFRRIRVPEREIYGFIAWVVIVIVYVLFLTWAFLPNEYIEEIGITYYPDKRWSLRISTYVVFVMFCFNPYLRFYQHYKTPPLNSKHTYIDEDSIFLSEEEYEVRLKRQVPPMRDIPIELVNQTLFHKKRKE